MRSLLIATAAIAVSFALGGCVDTIAVSNGASIGPGYTSARVVRDDGYVRIIQRGDRAYFNGYRGYRNQRAGYRSYQGYWFPGTAFVGMITINGGYQQDRPRYAGNSHQRWCTDRYRSYQGSDNSYNIGQGGRRYCNSPYN